MIWQWGKSEYGMSVEIKSRTQKKKEAQHLQKLGERLVALSAQQLEEMELPEEIFQAVKFAQTIKQREAYRRQMQYIGALMRKIDFAPLQKALEDIDLGNRRKALEFQKIEQMRDELVNGNDRLIAEIIRRYPQAESQKLNQLVRQARKESMKNKSARSSRMLFRYLRRISE